jgi:hypothetical protein
MLGLERKYWSLALENGYMTKYMHEALGCEVFAVELDETHIGELDKHTEGYFGWKS